MAPESGGADTQRDPRGFALKFPDFIDTQKRDPYNHVQEPDNVWDFAVQARTRGEEVALQTGKPAQATS